MKEAIGSLVDATLLVSPACKPKEIPAAPTDKPCPAPDPEGAKQSRLDAIAQIAKAKKQLAELEKSPIPQDLEVYLKAHPNSLASDKEVSLSQTIGITVKQIQNLLDGTIKWINQENESPITTGATAFIPASFASRNVHLSAHWFPALWDGIRWVLGNVIPELTDDRANQLYRKKVRLNIMFSTEDEQFDFFDRFLPKLKEPSKNNLEKDAEKRAEAASALARLSSL